jgi:phenylpropionate dioxygenase-like ring-hydroxylating dioxygenase large terminal subunit
LARGIATNGDGRRCPIDLAEFEDSVADPLAARFFPPAAYVAEDFYRFELGAVWDREWLCVGRLEEIPEPGDYFGITVAEEPLLIVRAAEGEVVALSAVCRHRGMIVAEGRGNCGRAFVCPYHHWAYDRRGRLIAATQMDPVGTFNREEIRLPSLRAEIWQGFVFVNFDEHAAPLAERLAPLDELLAPYHLEALRGEFMVDPDYRMYFDYDWNWKVYMDGQSECYHCDKLHGQTPCMLGYDFGTMAIGIADSDRGIFNYHMRSPLPDVTLNHTGTAIFPVIEGLDERQRSTTHSIVIAPGVFIQLLPDSVIAVSWSPTGPGSVRIKRHRLYPKSTLEHEDFLAIHAEEQKAVREFVEQDLYVFAGVQRGLRSRFAPRGPISAREQVMVGFNRWLVDRYRRAEGAPSRRGSPTGELHRLT